MKFEKKFVVFFLVLALIFMGMSFAKSYTLTLLQQDVSPYNEEEMEFLAYLTENFKKETGIDLTIEPIAVPSGNYSEKVNLLLAGGTYPDIIWWRDDAELPYIDQGLLLDLSDYVNNSEVFQEKMPEWNLPLF